MVKQELEDGFEPEKPVRARKSRQGGLRVGVAGLVALVVISGGAGFLGGLAGSSSRTSAVSENRQTVLSEEQLINGIAKDVGPSVVSINVTSSREEQQAPADIFEQYFGQRRPSQDQPAQQSAGTGVILNKDGVILTNRHVVPENSEVSVTLSDGTELKDVEIVGRAAENSGLDVAFLKIKDKQGKDLKPAKLADSAKTQVGDKVVAIGNALGQFQNSVTAGIISGYGRSVTAGTAGPGGDSENLQDLFQTDAAINQGNSGGPLVNANGEVIGINTAVAGDAQNIGFAIPINDLKGLINTVLKTGKFEQPYLGVRYQTLTDDVAKQLDLSVTRGAYVLAASEADGQDTVIDGSPADDAGVEPRDIIQSINGKDINERSSLSSLLAQYSVGETVELKVLRGNETKTLRAKLESVPQN